MQFKNPEVLYFLALLIIPILVHLFQLQKFVKMPFTNVAFLQKLAQQTRKSSRIKKWLILATRMLLFSAIIFAFSQPYFSDNKIAMNHHTFVYLDTSLSTDTDGEKGNLLQIAAQEIIENASEKDNYSLQTNTDFDEDITFNELKKKLLNVKNTSKKLAIETVLLKLNTVKKIKTNTLYKSILISDFQYTYSNEFTNVTPAFLGVQLKASIKNNISIDSVFTNNASTTNLTINVLIKNQGVAKKNIPIAIFNDDNLLSKQSFSIDENTKKLVSFTVQNQTKLLGKISLTFSDTFSFDNTFYFSLNSTKKANVLSIGKEANFLSRIYTKEAFNFLQNPLQNVNYNAIPKQQIIILNELEKIPESLSKSLLDFSKKGGSLVIIPNSELETKSYNLFLNKIADAKIISKISDTLKITNINFEHPLFKNVFSKKVTNFQYPTVKSHYPILAKNNSTIISLENNAAFISQIKASNSAVYWIASSLSKEQSNFLNSPLIVPVFYNFGKLSFQHAKLYYYLDAINAIDVETDIEKDEILSIVNPNFSFIPPQQTFQNKVRITTKERPTEAGFYHIIRKKDTLQTIAFNNPKEESSLTFLDVNTLKEATNFSSSIKDFFTDLNEKNEVQWLWKWFLTLAIVSLLLEILILKFYKP
ncbi:MULTISPECIES: BatA domain-containing protein [unclassified Polaribacter]|uniref:BatA domain-containing protein n=1 Tax=unclassified Polaribacter TaxID=196858 RepID=UPI0011BE067D|nr:MULTISPECIES: BatA domain-containing protein [unclassified Polaribacter]TXD50890.1 hypothetical protein ES043_14270 [Polaribacter sp. IC063]TXD57563.1 hypothetical protein ES044_14650 [Polaribacter sp. IC066]